MSKTIVSIFIVLIPFLANAEKAKKEILKQLNFTEGQYEVIVPKSKAAEFCEDEILKIEMLEDKDDVSLLIGAKLVFPQINKSSVTFESDPNCKTTQTNQIENKKLTIVQTEKCTDEQKPSNSKEFQFVFKNDVTVLSMKDGDKTTSCQYKKTKKISKGK